MTCDGRCLLIAGHLLQVLALALNMEAFRVLNVTRGPAISWTLDPVSSHIAERSGRGVHRLSTTISVTRSSDHQRELSTTMTSRPFAPLSWNEVVDRLHLSASGYHGTRPMTASYIGSTYRTGSHHLHAFDLHSSRHGSHGRAIINYCNSSSPPGLCYPAARHGAY